MNYSLERTDPQKNLFSWERQKTKEICKTAEITTVAAATSIPTVYETSGQFAAAYTGEDTAPTILCSGVPHMAGTRFGVLMYDSRLASQCAHVIEGEALLLVDPAVTWADGDTAYYVPSDTATTGGLITNTANAGANKAIGHFIGASTDTTNSKITVSSLSPKRLPNGTYARVYWFPTV